MAGEKTKSGLLLTGAVGAAVAASLCCILPVLAAGLGVAGFAAANWFAPWRPYLMAVTFALLGVGFYFAYRPRREEACEPGSVCETTPVGRWNRVALWVATVIVVALAAFPYYGPLFTRAAAAGKSATVVPAAPGSTEQVVLNIEGMDCVMCAAGLQNSLRQIPGVASAEVSYQEGLATISYDPNSVQPSRFEQLITDSGYKVVAKATPPAEASSAQGHSGDHQHSGGHQH